MIRLTGREQSRIPNFFCFENFIIQEVVKKYSNLGKRPNIYYLRTHNQLEVDLLIENGLNIIPVEIKLAKTLNLSMAKPLKQIKKLFPSLNFEKGIILSLNDDYIPLDKETEAVPFKKFLELESS